MKKIFAVLSLLLLMVLVGCTSTLLPISETTTQDFQNNPTTVELDTNDTLAFSTYLASGLLSSSNQTSSASNMTNSIFEDYKVSFLTSTTTETTEDDTTLEIETELDEVNIYFNKLKVFMEGGVEEVLNITQQTSTIEGYDFEMTYSIEDVNYTIYYSIINPEENNTTDETTTESDDEEETTTTEEVTTTESDDEEETTTTEEVTTTESDDEEEEENDDEEEEDEDEFQLVGLMVIDGVSYELVGANEIEENEQKMWFETKETNDSENHVRVEIKNEEGEQKFEVETVLNGVNKQAEIKFEQEEDETKVELKLINGENESEYEFKKELEDGENTYKFEYNINGVEGEVKIIENIDQEGNKTYQYEIEENGKSKEIGKPDPDDEEEDDDDDNEEEEEEETSEEV